MSFYIRPRRAWRARAPRQITQQNPHNVHTIVVHHTAGRRPVTRAGAKREMRAIQDQHMDARGWSDVGYNYVIDGFGRVWEGRGAYRVGAHTLGHNTNTIGISFMGNYETMKPTRRQLAAYRALLKRLASFGVKPEHIKGHRQMPDQATACPGLHLMLTLGL